MTIIACVVFRVIGVLLLSAVANMYRINKLSWTEQLIMMYGGLRGGVAFALVLLIDEGFAPHAKMFVTTTLAMVYWTVFFQVSWLAELADLTRSQSVLTITVDSPPGHHHQAGRPLLQGEEED